MSKRQPPEFFFGIRHRARKLWENLLADPELLGPWKQLFRQVQSPRHVLSELLQNAEDAGAKRVTVSLENDRFVFEHDGKDFNSDEFASLCRFGYSNKRELHSIGFRGIGFKSTFSLGPVVELLTPSLAVRFHKDRFTEPVWVEDAPPSEVTRISVDIHDPHRKDELKKNLTEWVQNPVSLLFLKNVETLTIDGVSLRRQPLGPGPVPGSQKVRLLGGRGKWEVIVFVSAEEAFPSEALKEISQERDVEDLNLPPCAVQIVLGLPGEQRIYVMLPTDLLIDLPFSCNAPFLQDPGRAGVKEPSLSPTNRWLIRRIGHLAANAMLGWLRNSSLPIAYRAKAYNLLPRRPKDGTTPAANILSAICAAFEEVVREEALLLTADGALVSKERCLAPPHKIYSIWTKKQILQLFDESHEHLLCEYITSEQRDKLESWGFLNSISSTYVIERLQEASIVPRPSDNGKLLALWSFVRSIIPNDYDYKLKRLAVVPVVGKDVLYPASSVVRLPSKKEGISIEAWRWLASLVSVVDQGWLGFINSQKTKPGVAPAWGLLEALGLSRPSDGESIAAQACRSLFARGDVSLSEGVRIAHLLAALDVKTPIQAFRCFTRDGVLRGLWELVLGVPDAFLEELCPSDWAEAHMLHEAYFSGFTACTPDQWMTWIKSEKSRFFPSVPLVDKRLDVYTRHEITEELARRGATSYLNCPYVTEHFRIFDYDFEETLWAFWSSRAEGGENVWHKVATALVQGPDWYWKSKLEARLEQISQQGNAKEVKTGFPPAWVVRLRDLPCLLDSWEIPRVPAELYVRTPDTEPFLNVEPFVQASLDTEATRPLLLLLGARSSPASMEKLLARIRALSQGAEPVNVLKELKKWYSALNSALYRCGSDGLEEVREAFADERLIVTADGKWARADEVFLDGNEEWPEAPLVHPAIRDLELWVRVGVSPRPTVEKILGWLANLPSGEPIEQSALPRVRTVLGLFPRQVWDTCAHWLNLDGAWVPLEALHYSLHKGLHHSWDSLFPSVTAATADFRMLSPEVCSSPPFVSLPSLHNQIKYRLNRKTGDDFREIRWGWLSTLARVLLRVRVGDDARSKAHRMTAKRLLHTKAYLFDSPGSLTVTPYLGATPAGPSFSPLVFWEDTKLFIAREDLASVFHHLEAELSKPFSDDRIREAIRVCIGHDEEFITSYFEHNFELHSAPIVPEEPPSPPCHDGYDDRERPGGDLNLAGESGFSFGGEGGTQEPHSQKPKRQQPSFFACFAMAKGFTWHSEQRRFIHPDGSWMERCDRPFHWLHRDKSGAVLTRYWAMRRQLRDGVELPAELWEYTCLYPAECSFVLLGRNGKGFVELSGLELLRMVQEHLAILYPARYRLRER